MNKLFTWGWDDKRSTEIEEFNNTDLVPGRIISSGRGIYSIITAAGDEKKAEISGGFRYRSLSENDFPIVGDFVLYREEGGSCIIEKVMSRRGELKRKSPGSTSHEQIIAANIDLIFLVFALDGSRNFNIRGMERLLTLAWDSGAQPVVILNKLDLAEHPEESVLEAESSAPGVPILAVSATEGTGIDQIQGVFPQGKTAVMIGRSGVGKSAIANAVSRRKLSETGSVRESDKRGKHTTTSRELFMLPHGGMLIDSPGIREVQLTGSEESLMDTFEDIAEFASQCKFNDCNHSGEPGCAVQNALNEGILDYKRYEAYLDQKRELRYQASRANRRIREEEERKWKGIAQFSRQIKKARSRR